jgi:tRNA-uridine 2-sulfurtransferase
MPRKRVAVAMSGGVDSSVAAAVLLSKGHDVVGLTLSLMTGPSRCCSPDDVHDARRVARILGIAHYVIDAAAPFREAVIEPFLDEYRRGRTPNPCAVCNPRIKFGTLLDRALGLGAEKLATGHYAIVSKDRVSERLCLRRGRGSDKDQSYFLARLSQDQLGRVLFPVGRLAKPETRAIAERFGLPVAFKRESQEACFIPDEGVAAFIERERGDTGSPGPIVRLDGTRLGQHRGLARYTVGQRKGLGLATGEKLYVVRLDAARNTVLVGGERELFEREFTGSEAHWISIAGLAGPERMRVRIRYRHTPASAVVRPLDGGRVNVVFDRPQRAVTPGQLAVFYRGDRVLGSAWIDSPGDGPSPDFG